MSCRLVLTRHAKSDWSDPRLDDHDRPLNARGAGAAAALGPWIAARAAPDQVLVSTALRATGTWDGIAPALPFAPDVLAHRGLYLAAPDTMLSVLRQAAGRTVLMIGHNPGICGFAAWMIGARPRHPKFGKYPTGATLIAEFDIDAWTAARPGAGRVVDFTVPKDL